MPAAKESRAALHRRTLGAKNKIVEGPASAPKGRRSIRCGDIEQGRMQVSDCDFQRWNASR
jgi:hypothetical protein